MSNSDFDSLTDAASQSSDCTPYEPLLTALFDGEATREQTRMARAHLEACARCADAWLSWTRTRYLLRADFVPLPPPSLLLRILLACRLSALPRKPRRCDDAPQSILFPIDVVPDLSITKDERALTNAAMPVLMLDNLHAPPPPAHLHDAILRRTVGSHETMGVQEVVLGADSGNATGNGSTQEAVMPIETASRPQRTRAATHRASRFLPTLAVPALAAWVMFATIRPDQLGGTPQAGKLAPAAPQRTSIARMTQRAPRLVTRALHPKANAIAVAPAVARPDAVVKEQVAVAPAAPLVQASFAASTASLGTSGAAGQVKATFATLTTSAPPRVAMAAAPRPGTPSITLTSWSPTRRLGARTDASTFAPAGFSKRMRAMTASRFEPRHDLAARLRDVPAPPLALHVAAPTRGALSERTAPQPIEAALDDDEALNEVRFVVSDFRGSLAAEAPEDEFDAE